VAGTALGVDEMGGRAMLVTRDAEAGALPLNGHEDGIATLRVTASAIQRRVDAEVCLTIVLDVRESEVGRFAARTIPVDTRNLSSVVAAGALLDAWIAVVRPFLEHAGVTSDASWKKALVFCVREPCLVGA
jgi:hypothetical protein